MCHKVDLRSHRLTRNKDTRNDELSSHGDTKILFTTGLGTKYMHQKAAEARDKKQPRISVADFDTMLSVVAGPGLKKQR